MALHGQSNQTFQCTCSSAVKSPDLHENRFDVGHKQVKRGMCALRQGDEAGAILHFDALRDQDAAECGDLFLQVRHADCVLVACLPQEPSAGTLVSHQNPRLCMSHGRCRHGQAHVTS